MKDARESAFPVTVNAIGAPTTQVHLEINALIDRASRRKEWPYRAGWQRLRERYRPVIRRGRRVVASSAPVATVGEALQIARTEIARISELEKASFWKVYA